MHRFRMEQKYAGEKLQIAFSASPEDEAFRKACGAALSPHGFVFDYDGHYFFARHPDPESSFATLSIESDEWGCVWGEGNPWGSVEHNHRAIAQLASLLTESGHFGPAS